MRVTGGKFCGRKLSVPSGDKVRPTQDRVREALFSMLMHDVSGALFVDLFAGSGAVGLEALSRGADQVVWVEQNNRHVKVLRGNSELLAPGRGEIVCADVKRWLKTGGRGRGADVVFADPPYQDALDNGFGGILALLAENSVVVEGGFFVAEMPVACDAEEVDSWELMKVRTYGHTRLAVYKRVKKC